MKLSGLKFEVRKYPFDEAYSGIPDPEVPQYLARKKSEQVEDLAPYETLITADTLVILSGKIIGKPKDPEDAFRILKSLSGKVHEVITGVAIRNEQQFKSFHSKTEVWFDVLEDEEIQEYLEKFEPFDKAGAYGIQEGIGLTHIGKIEGCYFNVMGLPMRDLYQHLRPLFS